MNSQLILEKLVTQLRASEEWKYVDREIDIRLKRIIQTH